MKRRSDHRDIDGYVDGELADSFSTHVSHRSGQLIGSRREDRGHERVCRKFVVDLPKTSEDGETIDRDVKFEVSVKDIKAKQLPDLDDDFAKDIGGVDTLTGLRDRIMHSLRHRALDDAIMDLSRRALSSLATTSEVDIPRLLIDREADEELEGRWLADRGPYMGASQPGASRKMKFAKSFGRLRRGRSKPSS